MFHRGLKRLWKRKRARIGGPRRWVYVKLLAANATFDAGSGNPLRNNAGVVRTRCISDGCVPNGVFATRQTGPLFQRRVWLHDDGFEDLYKRLWNINDNVCEVAIIGH